MKAPSAHGRKKQGLLLATIALGVGVSACTGEVNGVFKTTLEPDKAFSSASDAMRLIGFLVKQQDVAAGSLSGEKYAMAKWSGPALVRINVKVEKVGSGTELRVQVMPPSGAYGSSRIPFGDYAVALQRKIPDIAMVSVQGD